MANGAAFRAIPGLRVAATFPVADGGAEGFARFLRFCEGTSEPVPHVVVHAGPDGEPVRRHCRGRRVPPAAPGSRPGTLLHLHSTGLDRRFGLLAQRLTSARKVMDGRRRRERELRAVLQEREALLLRLETDADARLRAERERDETLARLYNAGQDERQRLARDLHDHAGQQVVALNLGLGRLARHLDGDDARAEHRSLLRQVQDVFDSLRRVVLELRPPALDEFGFVTALEAMVREWSERSEVPTEFRVVGDRRAVPSEAAITLYRITQEALNNVSKHAGAVETVAVILRFDEGGVTLTVDDDGAGFDCSADALRRLFLEGRLGLAGMRERLALIGGALRIDAAAGRGSTVSACVDLREGRHG